MPSANLDSQGKFKTPTPRRLRLSRPEWVRTGFRQRLKPYIGLVCHGWDRARFATSGRDGNVPRRYAATIGLHSLKQMQRDAHPARSQSCTVEKAMPSNQD